MSTGYTALAWINENIKRTYALTLDTDFSALLEEFIFTQSSVERVNRELFSEDYAAIKESH